MSRSVTTPASRVRRSADSPARGGSTAFMTADVRAFQDDATRRLLDQGSLRMYTLRLDGVIAAVMYGMLHDGTFYFYQHGFDPQHHRVRFIGDQVQESVRPLLHVTNPSPQIDQQRFAP